MVTLDPVAADPAGLTVWQKRGLLVAAGSALVLLAVVAGILIGNAAFRGPPSDLATPAAPAIRASVPHPESLPPAEPRARAEVSPAARPAGDDIPADVTWQILDQQIIPEVKRSLDVRLSRKVSEAALRSIAVKLKDADPRSFERTFIGYYLPGQEVGAGAWATTHFNPTLEVRILGLIAKQEDALKKPTPADPGRKVIGSWLDDSPWSLGKLTIFLQAGKPHLEIKHPDGGTTKRPLVEKPSSKGRKFMEEGATGPEDGYYLINSRGDLELWSEDGAGRPPVRVGTAKKGS